MIERLSLDAANTCLGRLPSLPTVVLRVLESFARDDVDVDQLGRLIAQDQALTARVLRLANSSFYGLQKRVGTLGEAIVVLGFRNVRATVAAVAATSCFAEMRRPGFDFSAFWRHCAAVGIGARVLADAAGKSGEQAFVAGLLHDVGILVLLTGFPDHMRAVSDYHRLNQCLYPEAEREVLGIDHAQIGEMLAQRWHFPEVISAAIAHHHHPADAEASGLAGVVHLADCLAHALGIMDTVEEVVPPVDEVAFNRLGIGVPDFKRALHEVHSHLDELGQLLTV